MRLDDWTGLESVQKIETKRKNLAFFCGTLIVYFLSWDSFWDSGENSERFQSSGSSFDQRLGFRLGSMISDLILQSEREKVCL